MDLGKQKRIQRHFEEMHQKGWRPWREHGPEPLLDKFLKILKETKPGAKVLDLGCGDGWISIRAARQGFRVWGLDSSPTAIGKAKEDATREGVTRKVNFRVGDALDLPYKGSFFEALIDRGLFHHILPGNRPLYFQNILRVLKPQGLLYLSVFSQKNPWGIGQLFSRKLIKELFTEDFAILHFAKDTYPPPAPAHLLHFILRRK